ncbi:MAG TPA: hypothetical protein ENH62_17025 [Marinobacter sp.]|uniref:Glycosyltransferase RgtA/B/C/D-like domain-containing protein n=1 Tax=marine sediment metagenome TaxID=412755 RepID=A0A0F9QHD2_9ZZZZ|nr:hypothetical protein [Marinobacter sp.]
MKQRVVINTRILLGLLVFCIFSFLSLTGVKVFEPWPQVTLLWDSGQPLLYFIDHFHFERYLVVYPGLLLEELYPRNGFSIYISFFAALNALLFRQVHKTFTGYLPGLLVYSVFLLVHFLMNGRGPIGWSGWLLCLNLHGQFGDPDRTGPFLTVRNSSLLFFSILFSTVTSGIFIVVFIANAILVARVIRTSIHTHLPNFTRLFVVMFAIFIIGYGTYLAIIYMLEALIKVSLYYGSYTGVIMHGIGILAQKYDFELVLLLIAILAIILIFLWRYIKGKVSSILWPIFITSMVGGSFGFTTLTLTIPLFLIFFSVLLKDMLRKFSSQRQS